MNKDTVSCPECGIPEMSPMTWIVHREVHKAPMTFNWQGLSSLSFALMPAVGGILDKFGMDLLEWMQERQTKSDHACVTGDCDHESQVECWGKLVHDCAMDLREKQNEKR